MGEDVLMTLTCLTLRNYFAKYEPSTLKQSVRATMPISMRGDGDSESWRAVFESALLGISPLEVIAMPKSVCLLATVLLNSCLGTLTGTHLQTPHVYVTKDWIMQSLILQLEPLMNLSDPCRSQQSPYAEAMSDRYIMNETGDGVVTA